MREREYVVVQQEFTSSEPAHEVLPEAPRPMPELGLDAPVAELELSVRSRNCLAKAGVKTVGDLIRKTRRGLLETRGLGRLSLREIEERLREEGLTLAFVAADAEPRRRYPDTDQIGAE
jgi:DNA-directed RNA polymerase subunit alpha